MRRVKAVVPIDECIRRAHAAMSTMFPKPASMVAQAIWPDAEWRAAQGAGAAASRVLKRMEKAGTARWIATKHDWGWIRAGDLQPTLTVTPSREPSVTSSSKDEIHNGNS